MYERILEEMGDFQYVIFSLFKNNLLHGAGECILEDYFREFSHTFFLI